MPSGCTECPKCHSITLEPIPGSYGVARCLVYACGHVERPAKEPDLQTKLREAQELGRRAWVCHGRAVLERDNWRGSANDNLDMAGRWRRRCEAAERDAGEKGALLAKHHHDSTRMWKCCPICGMSLTPAEKEAPE